MNQFVTSLFEYLVMFVILNTHKLCCHCSVLWQGRMYMWQSLIEVE